MYICIYRWFCFICFEAGALLSCAGAMHWGMQLAELGVPKRSDYMGLRPVILSIYI